MGHVLTIDVECILRDFKFVLCAILCTLIIMVTIQSFIYTACNATLHAATMKSKNQPYTL